VRKDRGKAGRRGSDITSELKKKRLMLINIQIKMPKHFQQRYFGKGITTK
jgi:hypothetical protein